MFETALKAGIPIIGVQTDDIVNAHVVLQSIAHKQPLTLKTSKLALAPDSLYIAYSLEHVTTDNYRYLAGSNSQLVVINPDKPHTLVFDGGQLVTPESMLETYLKPFIEDVDQRNEVLGSLKGMSLKAASEVVMLTQARTGGTLPKDIRYTRGLTGSHVHGLALVDIEPDLPYDWPDDLLGWVKLNKSYFLAEDIPTEMRPRGLLLDGEPGTGKSMGAKAIAQSLAVPLYRLNLAMMLNRYIGASENRLGEALGILEKEAPCVLLIDEVEKLFKTSDEGGTTTRMLSQLLWWMAEHDKQVLTIMTTNDRNSIPPELYREGRIDKVFKFERLTIADAAALFFAKKVYQRLTSKVLDGKSLNLVSERLAKKATNSAAFGGLVISHAAAHTVVIDVMKEMHFFKKT